MNKTIDVIMPNYNKSKFISEAIDSVINQSYKNWKLYIIDDNSHDNSKKILQGYKKKKKIKIFFLKKNMGPAFCRNYGLTKSKSNFIAFLDSDDYWYPEKLELTKIATEQGSDFIYHGFKCFGDGERERLFYPQEKKMSYTKLLFESNSIATSTVVVRKERVDAVDRFSESPQLRTAEDYDLWLRLFKKGINSLSINKILGGYRLHGDNSGGDSQQFEAVERILHSNFKLLKTSLTQNRFRAVIRIIRNSFSNCQSIFTGRKIIKTCLITILISTVIKMIGYTA